MTVRDQHGTPPLVGPSGEALPGAALPVPAVEPTIHASLLTSDAATKPRGDASSGEAAPGAAVLSLDLRKEQLQREKDAARMLRIAAILASNASASAPVAEGRPDAGQAVPAPVPASAPKPAEPKAPALKAVPALGGVRPEQGLSVEAQPHGERHEQAGLGPAASVGTLPSRPNARPAAVPPAIAETAKRAHASLVAPDKPRAPAAPKAPAQPEAPIRKPAVAASAHRRHWLVMVSFALVVLLPTALAAWYVWNRAAPRYASYAGFSVRTEDTASATMGLLGGVAALAGASSSSDTDILYEFIRSQEIVDLVDRRLDLEALWSKGDPSRDPVYAYHAPGTIEDLHDYWNRMVEVYNDGSTGLLDIEVQAFTPEDANAIATAIYDESSILINRLSDIAQEDGTRYAEEELATSVERLKLARAALTQFRNETQIIDPVTALAGQMGLLSQLEGQLAQALIELDLLRQSASGEDPRIAQAETRVAVIEQRMEAERAKLGLGPTGSIGQPVVASVSEGGEAPASGEAFADLVGQYEGLAVDQEFASQAYTAALAAYDAALGESRRQSRYLAAHVQPTLAQRADFPARITLTALTFLFALLAWTILTLGGYALRDRR